MRRLLQLVHLIAVWTLAIWINWNPDWLAEQVVQHTPDSLSAFCFGWLIAFSVLSWPLAVELAVEMWRADPHFLSRIGITAIAGGITLLGVGTVTLGIVGIAPAPNAAVRTYLICGLFAGGLTSIIGWLWHFIHKSTPRSASGSHRYH
jgi:hypothetical protein